jgi:predicted nucleotidyltransferase
MLNRLEKVFKSFRSHDLRYVVIGGVAAIIHGVPRATIDLDLLIEPTAQRLIDALLEAGLGTAVLTSPDAVLANEITVFNDYVRIDVQTWTPGLTFDEAWAEKLMVKYGSYEFYMITREHLIASKRAAGRQVDLEDVRYLEEENRTR